MIPSDSNEVCTIRDRDAFFVCLSVALNKDGWLILAVQLGVLAVVLVSDVLGEMVVSFWARLAQCSECN